MARTPISRYEVLRRIAGSARDVGAAKMKTTVIPPIAIKRQDALKCSLILILIIGLMLPVSANVSGTIVQLSTGSVTNTQSDAAISGSLVVWTNKDVNDQNVINLDTFLLDLTTGGPTNISNSPGETDLFPDVDGGTVVWTRQASGRPGDIVVYDVATHNQTTIATSTRDVFFEAPAVHGHKIAFERVDGLSGQFDIDLYSLDLGVSIFLTNDAAVQAHPRVGDDVVVYEDYGSPNGYGDVQGYRISTGASFPIAAGAAPQHSPDIDGNIVVWVEDVGSGSQIFARDLTGGTAVQLTTANSVKVRPRVSGNRVVWADNRNGDWDLYVYDLATRLEEPLVTGQGDQSLADIDGDRVAYTDDAAGFEQVYLFTWAPIVYGATVQQPINANGSSVFNAKRGVVPVKFTLALNGAPTCQLPPATIALSRTAGGTLGTINESDFIQPSDTGSNFRIDTANCQYVYNLSSSSLGPGTYLLQIKIGGVAVGSATFSLR